MDQRFAGVAIGGKPELGHQFGQLRAHPRDPVGRGRQRGAGPDPGMDRKRGHLVAFDHRNQKQVQRDAAMDIGDQIALDDQRNPAAALARPIEPGESAVEAGRGQQRLGAFLADPQGIGLAAFAAAGNVAKLGQHPVLEPAQQRRAFAVRQRISICAHRFLQARPIGHRNADIGERRSQRGFQTASQPRVSPVSFEIDHAFALFARSVRIQHVKQLALTVAAHCNHRVEQPINRQAMRGNGRGDRIDQKRHVIVDQDNPHEAFRGTARYRFDQYLALPRLALLRRRKDKRGRIGQPGTGKRRIARQQGIRQMAGQRLAQCRLRTHRERSSPRAAARLLLLVILLPHLAAYMRTVLTTGLNRNHLAPREMGLNQRFHC